MVLSRSRHPPSPERRIAISFDGWSTGSSASGNAEISTVGRVFAGIFATAGPGFARCGSINDRNASPVAMPGGISSKINRRALVTQLHDVFAIRSAGVVRQSDYPEAG